MARIVYATVLITLAGILVGCQPGGPNVVPISDRPPTVSISLDVTETDLVEEMTISRQDYEKGLQQLIAYYSRTGNNMKLQWARDELKAYQVMTKYQYIIGPTPGEYQATTPVAAADDLFYNAQALERSAGPVRVGGLRDKNKLRLAFQKYEQLIKDYPSSDKIDDAAFQAAVILEELGDYNVALDYFQRAFKWDPETPYPARFKAAYILDKYLHQYADALTLYEEAIKIEARYDRNRQWKDFAQQRVRELQKLGEGQN
jgi:tetratricopeptide (TPR) repeat protein